jgi:RNA polymerase sigma factor (sigma-70 family)
VNSCQGPGKSDADLVRDALRGAREPLAELVTRHWDTAVFLAGRVLGSPDLARDAAQEAAVAAMTDLDRLRFPDRFGAWFCGITLNVARRWLRQLRREVPGVVSDRACSEPGPAEAAEAADLASRVRGAVAALPGGQQSAVHLFYLQGLSHREVADELGISVGAVKSRLHQARAALAPRLAQIIDNPITDNPEGPVMAAAADLREWIDVSVTEVRRAGGADISQNNYIMMLKERDGERRLPIWIGPAEATALALALESAEFPRPFTYKLTTSLLEAAGSRLTEVRITRLTNSVFYAAVIVQGPDGPQEVDSRPSDAVNLALAAAAPIRADSQLFSDALASRLAEKLESAPVATAQIAAEVQQSMQALLRELGYAADASPASGEAT